MEVAWSELPSQWGNDGQLRASLMESKLTLIVFELPLPCFVRYTYI
jgi:hypothetical protein